MHNLSSTIFLVSIILCISYIDTRNDYRNRHHGHIDKDNDLSLWINEQQVKVFSGFSMKVYAIDNGRVNPHVRDKVGSFKKFINEVFANFYLKCRRLLLN